MKDQEKCMGIHFHQVDAFTSKPYKGNPAAVLVLYGPRDETWMQSVAREMNLSETAFLYPDQDGFGLRWFTPTMEVDLCGHATLSSAHVLWTEGLLTPSQTAKFYTKSGLLTARRSGKWIELDFPAQKEEPTDFPEGLAEALGAGPCPISRFNNDLLVLLDDEEAVRSLDPDIKALKELPFDGFIVTAPSSTPKFDIVSRFFGPARGVDEDPVTGYAHCCLAPFWQSRLDKETFCAYQASERGGVLLVRLKGDRVILSGEAVTVLRGELFF
jgi:PhzF family phenazine biosynthesis protein